MASGETAYADAVLADSPILYAPLSESVGPLVDRSASPKTLSPGGDVTFGVPGRKTGVLALGFGGNAALSTTANPGTFSDITVEFWVKTTSTGGLTLASSRGGGYSATVYMGLNPVGSAAPGQLLFGISGDSTYTGVRTNAAINDGLWHYVACTWDGNPGSFFDVSQVKIYIDGVSVTLNAVPYSNPSVPITSGSGYYFGHHGSESGGNLTGSMSDVAVYPTALSASRVAAHYAAATDVVLDTASDRVGSFYIKTLRLLPAPTDRVGSLYVKTLRLLPTPTDRAGSFYVKTLRRLPAPNDRVGSLYLKTLRRPLPNVTIGGGVAIEGEVATAGTTTIAAPPNAFAIATLTGVGSPASATGIPAGVQAGDMAVFIGGTQGNTGVSGWTADFVDANGSTGFYGNNATLAHRVVDAAYLAAGIPAAGITANQPSYYAWAIIWVRGAIGVGTPTKYTVGRTDDYLTLPLPAYSIFGIFDATASTHPTLTAPPTPAASVTSTLSYSKVLLAAYDKAAPQAHPYTAGEAEVGFFALPLVMAAAAPSIVPGGISVEGEVAPTGTTRTGTRTTGATATETNTAPSGTTTTLAPGTVTVPGGTAVETQTAQPGTRVAGSRVAGTTATETDTVRAGVTVSVGGPLTIPGGVALEGELARPGAVVDAQSAAVPVSAVTEHDAAQPIVPQLGTEQSTALGTAYEESRSGYITQPIPAATLTITLFDSDLDSTPESVSATVGNGLPYETITFELVGPSTTPTTRTVGTATLDETGATIVDVALPGVPAGSYNLRVHGTSSTIAYAPLTVRQAALSEDPEPDYVPTPPVVDASVHWQLVDTTPGQERHYTFTHNPAKWTNPDKPLYLEHKPTTAPDGNLLAWQGADRSWTFEFSGVVLDQAMYQELQFWASLRRRFWLIDHRGQARLVTFAQFDAKPRVVPNRPWVSDYTMRVVHFFRSATDSEEGT